MHGQQQGFTLIEVLVVIVIMAVMASAAISLFNESTDDASYAQMSRNVHAMQMQVNLYFAKHGEWPDQIDPDWFANGIPEHPYSIGENVLNSHFADGRIHPANKKVSQSGSYWYNSYNGSVRIRIPAQGSRAKNIALYNQLNSCSITTMNQKF